MCSIYVYDKKRDRLALAASLVLGEENRIDIRKRQSQPFTKFRGYYVGPVKIILQWIVLVKQYLRRTPRSALCATPDSLTFLSQSLALNLHIPPEWPLQTRYDFVPPPNTEILSSFLNLARAPKFLDVDEVKHNRPAAMLESRTSKMTLRARSRSV